jgi:hypothetical protein
MVGSLQMESLVTGKLFVGLEYAPTPAVKYLRPDIDGVPEIPTHPSNLESFSDHLSSIADGLSRINYSSIGSSLERIMSSVASMDLGNLSTAVTDFAASVADAVNGNDMKSTFTSVATLCKNLADLSTAVTDQLLPTFPQLKIAVEQASDGISNLFAMFNPNSRLSFSLERFLRGMESAARAMGLFFEFLEQYPNAILVGKTSGEN